MTVMMDLVLFKIVVDKELEEHTIELSEKIAALNGLHVKYVTFGKSITVSSGC